jgi:hypothetical protein
VTQPSPRSTPGILTIIDLTTAGKVVQLEKKTHTTPAASSEAWDFFHKHQHDH